jgi:hypothetical protein
MFRLNKTIIREPTVCASLKLQYWRQLQYFFAELFGSVRCLFGVPYKNTDTLCMQNVELLNVKPDDKNSKH